MTTKGGAFLNTPKPQKKMRTKTIKREIQRISTKLGVVTLKRKNDNNLQHLPYREQSDSGAVCP